VGFYLSSQGLWLDASTQAITQREVSLVTAAIRDSVRKSGEVSVSESPDDLHQQLALYRKPGDSVPYYYFWWDAGDSLVHSGTQVGGSGSGPMIVSHADRLQFLPSPDPDPQKPPRGLRVDIRLR